MGRQMTQRRIAVALSMLLAATAAAAQAGSPELLTVDEAVSLALRNHPLLSAAESRREAAVAESKLARTGWIPRIDLATDWGRSTNPVFVFASKLSQEAFTAQDFALDQLNSPDPYTNARTRLELRQNLWDAGRTSLGKKASASGIAAAEADQRRTADEVAYGAIEAFWSHVLAGEMLQVVGAAEKAAAAHASMASEMVEAGLAVPSDRMSADVRLMEVRALKLRAEQGRMVAHAALLQALGVRDGRTFETVPPATAPGIEEDDLETRLQTASSERSDLLTLDHRIDQAELGYKMARGRRQPTLGFGAGYEINGAHPLEVEGSNWSVGLAFRLPIFDGTEVKARVARARADRESLVAMRQAMDDGVRLQVQAAWAERSFTADRLLVTAAAEAQAAEALRIVRERYAEGIAVMVELLGAEAAHTRIQVDRASARAELALAQARLDLASGASNRSGTNL